MNRIPLLWLATLLAGLLSCKAKISERSDKLYSRHLQKNVELMVWNTPVPDNKSDFHLVLLNNAADFKDADVTDVLKNIHSRKEIKPLVLVAIKGEKKNFGIAGDGKSAPKDREAEKYRDFILNELLAHVKKQSGVRKFQSVALAGYGKAGITALDIGWNHADKINSVGIFEPDYALAGDTAIIFNLIKSSRKRPKTGYWFFDPSVSSDTTISNPTLMVAALMTQKVTPELKIESDAKDASAVLSEFLVWSTQR